MSTLTTKAFYIECNVCREEYREKFTDYSTFSDEMYANDSVRNDGEWHCGDDDNHYCPKCFTINDEDELILTPQSL